MSLNAWEWEDEDPVSMGPMSSMASFYQSGSECDVEEYLKVKAQAQELDSEHPCSSESSFGLASTLDSDVPQAVPCKFIISLAFPVSTGYKGKYTGLMEKHKKHPKMDKPAAKFRRYYHIEYFLLPDDAEPRKVDMVLFPLVAKVFLDSGVKTVRPWHEGDKVWVSWTQTFNINVTKELLKKINFHKITLKVWDAKDKVSRKVRYYRLKNTGYSEDMGSFGKLEVRSLVLNQRRLSAQAPHIKEEWNQEDARDKAEKAGKHIKSLRGDIKDDLRFPGSSRTSLSLCSTYAFTYGSLDMTSLERLFPSFDFTVKRKDSEGRKKSQKRGKKSQTEEETDLKMEGDWKHGTFSTELAVMPLLAGWQTIVSRGRGKSASILDCFLTLKTEGPIMTEEQKQDLNPLTIKIKCVSCLPSQPVPFHELERLCIPVYCKYQFFKTPVHRTEGRPHGIHIHFQDINVIFLGAMQPSDLREYLEGPPMVVQVHDRDRKLEEYSRKPTLFGDDPLDAYLNLQSLISLEETENNPFESHNKIWDPYGVAQVSFADLLLGQKYLNLVVPIHSCEPKPKHCGQDGKSRKVVGFRVPTDGFQRNPMPMGNYLEANSLLKMRVDIAVPLQARAEAPDPELSGTQFGRIIFVFDSKKRSLLYGLLQDITMINAKALDLEAHPIRNIQQILSAFKMRVKIQERQDLDVLNGFHLLDGKLHLLILEGLADQGLKQLWDRHQSRITRAEPGKHKVLYNSALRFRHRLYADLETVLYQVHLFKPLSQLMKHSALYVRNSVLQKAFQALTRIYSICHHSTRLREVISRGLLPSSAMVKDLSQQLGLPISQDDLADGKLMVLPSQPAPCPERFLSRKSTLAYEIQKNITGAYQLKKPSKSVVKVIRISAPAKDAVYNYSIQTLNSTDLAKKELYREMAKEPRKRFTYSQKYLSAMVEPQDSEEEEKNAKKRSRQAWLTANGFQLTGLHRSPESDCHLRLPPVGTEWRENAGFATMLDRERWGWDRRHQDFDLYRQPPPFLELPPPPVPRKTKASSRVS
uniref:Cilia and flagella associated protein 92 (putative) n=1 Tax=Neovison vison TaxID=452646 RepID=A0A8C7BP92_NEOVI